MTCLVQGVEKYYGLLRYLVRIWGMDDKIKNSKADMLFRGGGLEGQQTFWTLRPTKKLGTRSKVGN